MNKQKEPNLIMQILEFKKDKRIFCPKCEKPLLEIKNINFKIETVCAHCKKFVQIKPPLDKKKLKVKIIETK